MKPYYYIRLSGYGNLKWNIDSRPWNKEYYLSDVDYINIINVYNKIQDKISNIPAKSNILIDKASDIPRSKLKEFISDSKCKKVTLVSKANFIFIKRETINWIRNLKEQKLYCLQPNNVKSLLNLDYPKDADFFALSEIGAYHNDYQQIKNQCEIKKGIKIHGHRNTKTIDSINFILSLVNSKATLIFDDCLTKEMNSNGIDLDEEIFETLKGMLLSKDDSTSKLGIEMLCNVNLEENNIFKISLLMNYIHNSSYNSLKLNKFKTKNLKSLLDFLHLNDIRWNQSWEIYGISMWNRFKNTEHADFIKQFLIEHLNRHFGEKYKKETIEIVDIVFK